MTQKGDSADANLEKAAEALWNAEFLLVVAGPLFDDCRSPFSSEFCDPALVSKPNKFMGFWGGFFNEFMDRTPHDGFAVLTRWRDKLFCLEDIRKKKGQKRAEEETGLEMIARCNIYTNNIGNMFQKAGFPSEEVFEACGNIATWQCSRQPPCCNKVWTLDRAFRFHIDETNQEALPIKYVPDRRDKKTVETFVTVDLDDEELQAIVRDDQLVGGDAKAQKEAARRAQRRSDRAIVIRWSPTLQVGTARFPDLFGGFAVAVGSTISSITFPQSTSSAHAEGGGATAAPGGDGAEASPLLGSPPGLDAPLTPPPAPATLVPSPPGVHPGKKAAEKVYPPPTRVSHLLAHVDVLDRGMFADRVGRTYAAEPERWQRDRELQYQSVSKFFQADVHGVAAKRAKYVAYNISVIFTAAEDAPATPGCQAATCVLDPALRKQLYAVYRPDDATGPLRAQSALRAEYLDKWTQGQNGWFYFSNVKSKQTMQEPVNHQYHDVVEIPFPTDDEGRPTVVMPGPGGRVSVVCETVIFEEGMEQGGAKLGPDDNPYSYTRNVWQIAGEIAVPDFRDQNEFKGKEAVEFVLESRKRHVLKIGTKKSTPTLVTYIQLEVPCDELDPQASPSIVSTVVSSKDTSTVARGENVASFMENIRRDDRGPQRPPVPTPNHQLCVHCHDVGRPFVLMTRPGHKDDGFCTAAMAARTKAYKAWEKSMLDAMKQDANKSLVLLEVGCDKKMDAARSYSEKTFKSLKSAKCTFVRISPLDLETKKKQGGGAQEAGNYVVIQGNVVPTLNAIDRLLTEKMRKKAN